MLRRILTDPSAELTPIIVFGFTFLVFLFVFYRALKMNKESADRLGTLPLDGDDENS